MIGGLFWMNGRRDFVMERGNEAGEAAKEESEKVAGKDRSNNPMDTSFVDKALHFAIEAHRNTERRGKGTPYVLHVLEAAAIVETISPDPELIAAAALHDTIEDTDVSYEDILEYFGERVANLVSSESETPVENKSLEESWKERKLAAINRIAGSSRDAKIVALGDKLSNMRAIYRDYRAQGDSFWNIFHNKDPKEHEWHYRSLAEALSELNDTAAYRELVTLIDMTFSKNADEF